MLAAREAARAGARIIIVDEQNEFGGSMLASSKTIDGLKASSWIKKVVGELTKNKNVRMLPRSTAFGFYDHNFVAVIERRTDHLGACAPGLCRERIHRVRAKQVILATGALERPLVFAHNDIPGVMQASSVSAYIIAMEWHRETVSCYLRTTIMHISPRLIGMELVVRLLLLWILGETCEARCLRRYVRWGLMLSLAMR